MSMRGSSGFTLMEVIVAVAIVALMTGALAPVIYKQVNSARSKATTRELELIEAGLVSFYQDTGRFPSEAEGLTALIADPGAVNWQGPYVSSAKGNPEEAVRVDAFGQEFIYDLNPATTPAGAADVIVSSCGADLVSDSGRLNRNWDLNADCDDILALVSSAAMDRAKENEVRGELEKIAEACRDYYRYNATFPSHLSDLVRAYLDVGFESDLLHDPWNKEYRVNEYGGSAPFLLVYSFGPDQANDSGGDDDLSVTISSIPLGRGITQGELEIAQAALNADRELLLVGGWAGAGGIRGRLGLDGIFDLDGWGNSYGVNVGSRIIFSCGPDGDPGSTGDNLPKGVGP